MLKMIYGLVFFLKLLHKSMRRDEWENVKRKEYKYAYVNDAHFNGAIALLTFLEVTNPVIVKRQNQQNTVLDTNYKWLQFAPKNEHWWLTVLYDDKGVLLDSYFDITKENDFTQPDNPCFLDMFLDVIISRDKDPVLLDEDELYQAFQEQLITKEEYDLAFLVAKNIVEGYNRNRLKYYEFIDACYKMLQQ